MLIDIVTHGGTWPDHEVIKNLVQRIVDRAIVRADLPVADDAELSIVLSSDDGIRDLNRQYRKIDKATNVLSFPQFEITPGQDVPLLTGPVGDIVFARETIDNEAEDAGLTFEAHFSHLVVHGFLHLFGYDHQQDEDAEIMETLEITILADLGIPDPYGDNPIDSKYGSVA